MEANDQPTPPKAKVVPHKLQKHGDVRTDNYYWLNDRENPDTIAYLTTENAYLDGAMKHTEGLQNALFEEIKGRIKKDDASAPYPNDGYYYYFRYQGDQEYATYSRKKGSLDASEQIMIDANQLAEGHDFFSLGSLSVSSGRDVLAFSVDTVGRRFYALRFKNLKTGDMYDDFLPDVTGNVAWANDNKTIFYTKQDPETLRSHRIYRHVLGTDPAKDVLVYEEADEEFSCFISKSKSRKYLMIGADQTLSTEYRYLDAANPTGDFKVILPTRASALSVG